MDTRRESLRSGFIISIMLLVMLAATPGWAEVQCGNTIGPGEVATLTHDLTCPAHNPALTLQGGSILKLGRHTVDCDNISNVGIEIKGGGSFLKFGTVTGCLAGVTVGGEGWHTIWFVKANGNADDGFLIESDNNKFVLNTANNNRQGFTIDSNDNKFLLNQANENNDDGFDLNGGDRNKFIKNTANGNITSDGFDLDSGGAENHYIGNTANDNNACGFDIDGPRNLFIGNTANKNDDGFVFDGAETTALKNTANDNDSEGFEIQNDTDDSVFKKNKAKRNGTVGIQVQDGAQNNVLVKNTALKNTLDLQDQNASGGCDNNKWRRNKFGTADPVTCID